MPFLHVVAGLLIEDGKVFIAKRLPEDSNPNKWEFPGGKVEIGESPKQALKRELYEELELDVEVVRLFGVNKFRVPKAEFQLELYVCNIVSGTIILHEHSEYKWVKPSELKDYDMLPGDQPFIEELQKIKL